MRILPLLALVLAALTVVPAAVGGNWATVRLSSVPRDLAVGETWNLTIKVLQHGNPDTPVAGANPRVTLENAETDSRIVYTARPTEDPGSYRFEIVFPEAGEWSYSIYDGFEEFDGAQTHTYAPVTIGRSSETLVTGLPTEAETSGMRIWPVALGAAVLASGLALGAVFVKRCVSTHSVSRRRWRTNAAA